jgi:hypothetical protein
MLVPRPPGLPFDFLRAAGGGTTGLLRAPLEAVTTPAPSATASLALLLSLLASRLLGLERWAPFALGLFALRMRARLLRLFMAGRFLTPMLVALLLAALAAAVARSVGLRRLRLPLALPALLQWPVFALTARALALTATAARAVGGRWPRDFRQGRFLNRLAFEPAEQLADDRTLLRGSGGPGMWLRLRPCLPRHRCGGWLLRGDALDGGFRPRRRRFGGRL